MGFWIGLALFSCLIVAIVVLTRGATADVRSWWSERKRVRMVRRAWFKQTTKVIYLNEDTPAGGRRHVRHEHSTTSSYEVSCRKCLMSSCGFVSSLKSHPSEKRGWLST